MLIHQAIDYQARRRPEATAIMANEGKFSYSDLKMKSLALAYGLLKLNVTPGERIGLLGQNTAAHMFAFTACSRIGAVAVPLNYRLAPPESAYVCDDSHMRIIIALEPSVESLAREIISCRENETILVSDFSKTDFALSDMLAEVSQSDMQIPNLGDEQAPVVQLYTSGTTGKPKGAELSHRNFSSLMTSLVAANPGVLGVEGVDLVCAPMFHIGGSGSTIVPLLCGGRVIIHEAFQPAAVLEAIQTHHIKNMFMVPAMILSLLRDVSNFEDYDLSSLKVIGYGAAPISPTLLAEAVERFKCGFNQYYGMTETCGTVVALTPEAHLRALAGEPELLQAAGQPCLGVEAKVCDSEGNELLCGETGEIWLRSPQNMLSYYNLPEATRKTVSEGWVLTGDAGYINEEGFLFLRDRIKDMVVTGGENVYPVEVENVISQLPGVREVAVVGIPDAKYGEALLAVIAMNPETEAPTSEALIDFCRGKLAGYKIPRKLEIVPALPRNPTGKIQKMVLREPYWQNTERKIG